MFSLGSVTMSDRCLITLCEALYMALDLGLNRVGTVSVQVLERCLLISLI